MITTAKELAVTALRLLERCEPDNDNSDIELAAALMAVHVCDWEKIRGAGQKDVSAADKAAFGVLYPDWRILNEIANGLKHPKPRYPDIASSGARDPEWEDNDFWYAPPHATRFVLVNGAERSVHAVTRSFCLSYR